MYKVFSEKKNILNIRCGVLKKGHPFGFGCHLMLLRDKGLYSAIV